MNPQRNLAYARTISRARPEQSLYTAAKALFPEPPAARERRSVV
jgi:hypothetical protein